MKLLPAAIAAIACPCLFSSVVHAGDDAVPFEIGGVVGVGTPDGLVGAELQIEITRGLAIALGGGVGPGGGAASVEPRIFGGGGLQGVYGGAGLSVSDESFRCTDPSGCFPTEHGVAAWANTELGYEAHAGAWFARGFVGFSVMLNSHHVCDEPADSSCANEEPYLGLAVGASL